MESRQRCEAKGTGNLRNLWSSDPVPTLRLNMYLNEAALSHASNDWGRNQAVMTAHSGQEGKRRAEVLQMGMEDVHRKDNVGRVGLGTSIHPSCHSTPRTLDSAKYCSNTVIWTKNIGLSFLLPFF